MEDHWIGRQLSMDEIVEYEIRVTGLVGDEWKGFWEVDVDPIQGYDGAQDSLITGVFDQAALHGVLRHLLSRGHCLISVAIAETDGCARRRYR